MLLEALLARLGELGLVGAGMRSEQITRTCSAGSGGNWRSWPGRPRAELEALAAAAPTGRRDR